jgi:hypothetical protein
MFQSKDTNPENLFIRKIQLSWDNSSGPQSDSLNDSEIYTCLLCEDFENSQLYQYPSKYTADKDCYLQQEQRPSSSYGPAPPTQILA